MTPTKSDKTEIYGHKTNNIVVKLLLYKDNSCTWY